MNQREEYYGKTPLIAAAQWGALDVARLLTERGADIDARIILGTGVNSGSTVGETALVMACGLVTRDVRASKARVAIAFHLLECGANPDLTNESSGETALMRAVRCRSFELVERLLDRGADPNQANAKRKRVLEIASDTLTFNRRTPVDPKIVELLRVRGAI